MSTNTLNIRWRLAGGQPVLCSREMHALKHFSINGKQLHPAAIGWLSHLLDHLDAIGAKEEPSGVLQLAYNAETEEIQASIYSFYTQALTPKEAFSKYQEAKVQQKQFELPYSLATIATQQDDAIIIEPNSTHLAAATLLRELAKTKNIPIKEEKIQPNQQNVLFISDEYGLQACGENPPQLIEFFDTCYLKLVAQRSE